MLKLNVGVSFCSWIKIQTYTFSANGGGREHGVYEMRKLDNILGVGAVAALTLSSLALGAGAAQAQSWYGERTVERCSGDRCATYRCDGDGDDCTRVTGWHYRYGASGYYYNRGNAYGYDAYRTDYGRTMTRCDGDGDRCATFRCDADGDRCTRVTGWWYR